MNTKSVDKIFLTLKIVPKQQSIQQKQSILVLLMLQTSPENSLAQEVSEN